jgi:hypothetical protein
MSEWIYDFENEEYSYEEGPYLAYVSVFRGEWWATLHIHNEIIGQERVSDMGTGMSRCLEAIHTDYMQSVSMLLAVGA